ncbi:MFS general substrate transporter [Macrolepiota fuliginosa MF-IS2]|uniref:MFS general substrate transporter n=1 Tax=Macrolepiota fuliginosa MF-IS2 TaxID=1400762 RepID=A0A9P6C1C4_9AGAR|nr:MFS general substrate transporter [Macrolepiota fuliginosa MF-IS2]
MVVFEELRSSSAQGLSTDGIRSRQAEDQFTEKSGVSEKFIEYDGDALGLEEIRREITKTAGEDEFPDGGPRAWLVVFGSVCNAFSTVGYVTSWGTYQAYYQEAILKDFSPSSIAWIGSIQYALVFFPGLIVGRLFDLGYFHAVFISSSALIVIATFLVAQCKEYWQFLLCQGVAVGLGCGGVFGPTYAVLGHWFKKRRGLALGYMAIGASLGGTCLPIATRNLIPKVGFMWTMRIVGFILLVVLGASNLTMKRRLPPVNVKGGLFNFAAFKSAAYTIYCISSFLIFLGLYTLLTYVNVGAAQLGTSPRLSFYYVAFANAGSLLGRWVAGVLADRVGPLNVSIPFTTFAAILTYIWPFARSTNPLIAVTVVYGFCSGAYISLMTNPIMNLGGEGDVGRRVGMFMTILAFGALLGPPISGAIEATSGAFEMVGIYAGSVVMAGVACMAATRYLVSRRWIAKL